MDVRRSADHNPKTRGLVALLRCEPSVSADRYLSFGDPHVAGPVSKALSKLPAAVTGGIGASLGTPGLRVTTTRSASGSVPVQPGAGVVPAPSSLRRDPKVTTPPEIEMGLDHLRETPDPSPFLALGVFPYSYYELFSWASHGLYLSFVVQCIF